MKRQFKIWALRIVITGLFIVGLLLVIILNPGLSYANKTTYNNFTIYHHNSLDPRLNDILDRATELIKTSELYNNNLKLEICLNESSIYPTVVKAIRGRAFAWGFYNKVVMQGEMNIQGNYVELSNYKWNLTQLLAHEIIHCLQFDKFGLFKSKPLADIPNWKWEGYAEYVSRQNPNQKDLMNNLNLLKHSDTNAWEVILEDKTISSRDYYNYWILVKYCIVIKHQTFQQLLNNTTSEDDIKTEMTNWYNEQNTNPLRLNEGKAIISN